MIRVTYKTWHPALEGAVVSEFVGPYQKRDKRGEVRVPGVWQRVHEDFETREEAAEFIEDLKADGHRLVGWENV